MSQNRDDKPRAGRRGSSDSSNYTDGHTPDKGRMFVRTKDGSTLLGQTLSLFGKKNK
jgi:hypothetical protein